jgi:hypothetical protein
MPEQSGHKKTLYLALSKNEPELLRLDFLLLPIALQMFNISSSHTEIRVRFAEWHASFASGVLR